MKVPRSKVKTDYSRLLCCLVFVVESDLSFLLTHSIFALGFVLVAGRWRATGHSRAHGPTFASLLKNNVNGGFVLSVLPMMLSKWR